MPARHCCCCLPLRFGAFIISLFQFLLDGIVAASVWWALDETHGSLSTKVKIAIILVGAYYSVLALSAGIGFIGTLVRSRRALKQYGYWLWWAVGVNIALDVFYCVVMFTSDKQELIDQCINGSTDQNIIDTCNSIYNSTGGRVGIIVGFVIALAIQCWAAYIVSSYAQKLEEEDSWTATVPLQANSNVSPYAGSGYKYEATGRGSTEALTAPSYSYPYADNSHSFGNAAPYDPHQKA